MKKILHVLSYCLLLVAIPIVSKAIEFRTIPKQLPVTLEIINPGVELLAFKEGVIAYNGFDSLYYYNGSGWETYSEYSRTKYGQPSKIVASNDELFILNYGSQGNPGNVYKINSEGKVEKIEPKWDEFNSATQFGDQRSIRDIDVDANGNLYILTSLGIITQTSPFRAISESEPELLVINQGGKIIDYRRGLFDIDSSYNTTYNIRDSLPSGAFDLNVVKVSENGNIYLTGLSLIRNQVPLWELSKDGWKNIDFSFKRTNLNTFEPRFIHELNGKIYLPHYRDFEGVLFEGKDNDWTSYGISYIGSDVNVPSNNPFIKLGSNLRFGSLVEFNGEVYASADNLGIMKINKNEFVSYPVITDNMVDTTVSAIIKAKNSLWVTTTKSVLNSDGRSIFQTKLRLIDPAGLTKSSIEDETINPREILSVEYYDMIGKLLNESDINTGIPHIKYTKYRDGGFRAQKIVISE